MLGLIRDRVAVRMIHDADFTPDKITITQKELAYLGVESATRIRLEIPQVAKENADQGIVKYIGPDVKDIKIGDYVLFGGYDGSVMVLEDEGMLLLISEDYIKATILNINTDINGLYFRAKLSKDEEKERDEELEYIIRHHDPESEPFVTIKQIKKLFMKSDPYFTATHEMAIELITRAWQDSPLNIRTKNKIHDRSQSLSGEL